jgi:hypothetical protein
MTFALSLCSGRWRKFIASGERPLPVNNIRGTEWPGLADCRPMLTGRASTDRSRPDAVCTERPLPRHYFSLGSNLGPTLGMFVPAYFAPRTGALRCASVLMKYRVKPDNVMDRRRRLMELWPVCRSTRIALEASV